MRNAISLWDVSAQESEYGSEFVANGKETDVAIVGGGYTGLSTALHAAEAGLHAHVLEAKHVGFGGSGRNVGLVNAGVWLPPAQVRKALGNRHGSRFLDMFGNGPKLVFDLIEKHQIRCEATRKGTIHAAHAPSGFADLQLRHAEWKRMGAPVDLLDRDAVAGLIGSDSFHGGLVDHRAGTINPMGYCRGLARAALDAGAEISTGVTVKKMSRANGGWRLETEQGNLHAKSVVLGTNAYTDALWPRLNRIFTAINYFQLATAPLGPEAEQILPGRHGLWDTGKIMLSLRRDDACRLLVGSMGSMLGDSGRGLSRRWAQRQIRRIFPGLGQIAFEYGWHGRIAMTPDHLPRIYMLDQDIYASIGYNGRGITTGTIFGRVMADLIAGARGASLPLPPTEIKPVSGAPVMSRFYQLVFSANQLVRSF